MNPEIAWKILVLMAADYAPKPMPWTDPEADIEMQEMLASRWVNLLCAFDQQTVMTAIEEIERNSPTWPPTFIEMQQKLSAVRHRDASPSALYPAPKDIVPIDAGLKIAAAEYAKESGGKELPAWVRRAFDQ